MKIDFIHRNLEIIIIIIVVISVIVFCLGIFIWCLNDSGQFGNLIAGTFGVGISFCAMLALIITFREQQKGNKENEIQHLIENFNSRIDQVMSLLKEPSEKNKDQSINEYLRDLWGDNYNDNDNDNSIQYNLDRMTKRLRKYHYKTIMEKLKKICLDSDLSRISRNMNTILILKNKIRKMDPSMEQIADDGWYSLPDDLKKYAGFYYAWCKNESSNSIKEILKNELISSFYEKNEEKMPECIPQIKVGNLEFEKEIQRYDVFSNRKITISSESIYEIDVHDVKLVFYYTDIDKHLHKEKTEPIKTNILLPSKSVNTYSLQDIFGIYINDLIYEWLNKNKNDYSTEERNHIETDIEIYMQYKESTKIWIFEGKLEFNIYENHATSMIYKDLE
jgi:hypothetical protein